MGMDDIEHARRELSALKARSFVYNDATLVLTGFEKRIRDTDVQQRTFDGTLYASQGEALQASGEKQAIYKRFGSLTPDDLAGWTTARAWVLEQIQVYAQKARFIDQADRQVSNLTFVATHLPGYATIRDQSLFVFPHLHEEKVKAFVATAKRHQPTLVANDILVYFDETVFGEGSRGRLSHGSICS